MRKQSPFDPTPEEDIRMKSRCIFGVMFFVISVIACAGPTTSTSIITGEKSDQVLVEDIRTDTKDIALMLHYSTDDGIYTFSKLPTQKSDFSDGLI